MHDYDVPKTSSCVQQDFYEKKKASYVVTYPDSLSLGKTYSKPFQTHTSLMHFLRCLYLNPFCPIVQSSIFFIAMLSLLALKSSFFTIWHLSFASCHSICSLCMAKHCDALSFAPWHFIFPFVMICLTALWQFLFCISLTAHGISSQCFVFYIKILCPLHCNALVSAFQCSSFALPCSVFYVATLCLSSAFQCSVFQHCSPALLYCGTLSFVVRALSFTSQCCVTTFRSKGSFKASTMSQL